MLPASNSGIPKAKARSSASDCRPEQQRLGQQPDRGIVRTFPASRARVFRCAKLCERHLTVRFGTVVLSLACAERLQRSVRGVNAAEVSSELFSFVTPAAQAVMGKAWAAQPSPRPSFCLKRRWT